MGWMKRFLYGILLGIASIAPGISGGAIAIALGFYESLINAVANIFKQLKKNLLYLLPFGVGAVISIAAFSVILDRLFTSFPLPTNVLFIGFILGTFPFIKKKFLENRTASNHAAPLLITGILFFIIVIWGALGTAASGSLDLDTLSQPAVMVLFCIIGIVIAATLVIPGLSGTMILTALGFYKPLLHTASSFVTAATALNFSAAAALLTEIIPLGIGVLIGGILIAKLINLLFQKVPAYVYAAVLGLIVATPIVMLAGIQAANVTLGTVLASIPAFLIGLFLVSKIGEK